MGSLNQGNSASNSTFLQAGTGATPRTGQNKMRDIVSVRDFGAIGNNAADDTAAINAAFLAFGNVHFPLGTYLHTGTLFSVDPNAISITADVGTILNGIGIGYPSLWVGGVPTTYNPTDYTAGVAIGNAAAGDTSITTALACNAGDILRITSSDAWSVSCRSGELVEVASVAGNTKNLTRPLFGAYVGANTVAILQSSPVVKIENLIIQRASANDVGLAVAWARNLELNNVRAIGALERSIQTQFIYGGEIRNCYTRGATSATSYGMNVTTCYDLKIFANDLFGAHVGLSLTTYEPNRFVTITGNSLANNTGVSVGSGLNIHGGSEYNTVTDNKIFGGTDCAANNLIFTGNTIIGGTQRNTASFWFEHTTSDYTIIADNKILSQSTANGYGPLWVYAGVNNLACGLIRIAGNQIIGQINFTQGGIWISPYSTGLLGNNWTIDRLDLDRNDVTVLAGSNAASYALLINDATGGDTYWPIINNLTINGGYYYAASVNRAIGIFNTNSNVANWNGDIQIGGEFTASAIAQCVYINGVIRSATVANGIIKGGGDILIDNTALVDLHSLKIFNAAANSGISVTSGCGESIIYGNYYNNCAGVISDIATKKGAFGYSGAGTNSISWGTAAPIGNAYLRGDIVLRQDATTGQNAGWVCTVAGTPGTWKAMANLA